jgi:hypothetical protein
MFHMFNIMIRKDIFYDENLRTKLKIQFIYNINIYLKMLLIQICLNYKIVLNYNINYIIMVFLS